MKGKAIGSIWADVDRVGNTSGERLGYPTQKPLALLCRGDVFAISIQQRAAEGLLQAPDLLAYRRLGAMNAFAGAGEPAGVDDRDEAAQKVEIEHGWSHLEFTIRNSTEHNSII